MNGSTSTEAGSGSGAVGYSAKEAWYFEGCRRDYVVELPADPRAAILELGCAEGATGDPWLVLRMLRPFLRPGALVSASTPNVAHREVIAMLARGRWTLADSGTMDRTHLRWFTPSTFAAAFGEAGYVVDRVGPLGPLGPGSKVVDVLLRGRCRYLWHRQIDLRAHVADDTQSGGR